MTAATFIRWWLAPVLIGLVAGILLARFIGTSTTRDRTATVSPQHIGGAEPSPVTREGGLNSDDALVLTVNDLELLASSILKERWPTHSNQVALRGVLNEFASKYPRQFFAWMARTTPAQDLTWAVRVAVAKLLGESPEAAMQAVAGLRSRSIKLDALMIILGSVASADPARAMSLLSRVDSQFHPRLTSFIAENWGKVDPAAAIRFLTKLDMPAVRRLGLRSLFWRWAETDFEAAQKWANEHNLHTSFVSSLIENASPATAARALLASPIRNKEVELRDLARRWSAENPMEAVQWASALEHSRDRAVMTRALLDRAAERDLSMAAQMLEHVPSRDLREGFYRKFAQEKSVSDPQGALAWTTSLSDPVSRLSATRVALGTWAGKDPQAALTYAYGRELSSNERYAWLAAVVDGSLAANKGGPAQISQALNVLPPTQQAEMSALINARIRASQQAASGKKP